MDQVQHLETVAVMELNGIGVQICKIIIPGKRSKKCRR